MAVVPSLMLCQYLQDHEHLHPGLDMQNLLQAGLLQYYRVSPLKSVSHKHVMLPERVALIKRTWTLWSLLRKCQGKSLTSFFRAWSLVAALCLARRMHNRARRQAKRNKVEAIIQRANLAASNGDQRELFKLVRLLSPRCPRARLQLRSLEGALQERSRRV